MCFANFNISFIYMQAISGFFASDPNKQEPFSLLAHPIPMPRTQLSQEIKNLPQNYQTSQSTQQIQEENQNMIQKKFGQLIKEALQGVDGEMDRHEIVGKMNRNLRESDQEEYRQYADVIEKESKFLESTKISNTLFVESLSNRILQKYSNHYQLYPIPQHYYEVMDKRVEKKTKKSGLFSCFSSPRKRQRESQREQIQMKKVLEVQRNAQNLRSGINLKNSTGEEKILSAFILGEKVNKNLVTSHSNKITYDDSTFQNLAAKQKYSAPKNITIDGDFSRLSFYESNLIQHILKLMTPDYTSMISKNPYINNAGNYLQFAINKTNQISSQKNQFIPLMKSVESELSYAKGFYGKDNEGKDNNFYEIASWMIVIIHIYGCTSNNYDTFRRRILKTIFVAFANQDLPNPVEILRWLENHREQINALSQNQSYGNVISNAQKILLDVHEKRQSFLQEHTISEIPKLSLVHLSDKKMPRRKTVNIWVSGFLSEDMAKDSQWDQLVEYMPDSEVYALQWESDTIGNLVSFMGRACKDLLTGSSIVDQLNKKFKNNPFIPAFQTAKYSGRYLAEMLVRLFPHQFINIAGYSLGSELIKQFLERIIEMGEQSKISNIYMMGGVTDKDQLASIINKAKYPLCVYNCYTDNDMVLKHLLSQCKPDFKTIGLHEVPKCPGHEIMNVDVSDIISGHLAYMNEFDIVGKIIDMDRE